MGKLRALWKKDPGLTVSGGAHALALVFLLIGFGHPQKFEDAIETVPVDMITSSDLDQIMNGEKAAKPMEKPQRRVDKLADLEEHRPVPPLAEAKKDTPPPPSPDKPNDDPGDQEKPPEPTAALPPQPPAPPVPMPPVRPVEASEAPKPPPKPADVKPPPPDAEALEPKPPPRPKDEPKKEARHEPKPAPVPPKRPEPKKETLDQVAKLLATMKPPKPVAKMRAGNEAPEPPKHSDFSLDKITALLDHEAPQRKASTGHQLTQLASLGAPNTHAEKMSPSMMGQLDNWLIDHYRGCWSYFGLGATQDYVPAVRVRMAQDGSLIGQPALLNPPNDPNLQSLADSAIRAVNRCNPMSIPDRFKPYYDAWRSRVVRFDPKEMS